MATSGSGGLRVGDHDLICTVQAKPAFALMPFYVPQTKADSRVANFVGNGESCCQAKVFIDAAASLTLTHSTHWCQTWKDKVLSRVLGLSKNSIFKDILFHAYSSAIHSASQYFSPIMLLYQLLSFPFIFGLN